MLEMVLEAAEPGPLRLTSDGAEDWHILSVCVAVEAEGGVVSYAQEPGRRYKARESPVWGSIPLCVFSLTGFEERGLRVADAGSGDVWDDLYKQRGCVCLLAEPWTAGVWVGKLYLGVGTEGPGIMRV